MKKFIENIAEILEVEPEKVSMDSKFRDDFPEWDSMKGFAIICLLEDEYETQLDVKKFLECNTLNDLYELVDK